MIMEKFKYILMIILYHEILIPFHILCIQCIHKTTRINNVHMIFVNIYSSIGNLFVRCLFFFAKRGWQKTAHVDTSWVLLVHFDSIIICRYGYGASVLKNKYDYGKKSMFDGIICFVGQYNHLQELPWINGN